MSDDDTTVSQREELFGSRKTMASAPARDVHGYEITNNYQRLSTVKNTSLANDMSKNDEVCGKRSPNKSHSNDIPDLDTCTGGVFSMKLSQQLAGQHQASTSGGMCAVTISC